MPSTSTPLRYPGGKSKLAKYLSHLLRQNGLTDCTYVEPFAGGAGAAITLLRYEYVRSIYLNDLDPAVHAFWHAALHFTDELCRLIETVPLTIEEWRRQRALIDTAPAESIELGFAALYLNRTNRSGIIRGGVIGGIEQGGEWKIDARFNRKTMVTKIQRLAGYGSRIRLSRMDALDFLSGPVAELTKKPFVYLDPPYYVKGQALYENHYTHKDHAALRDALCGIGDVKWLASYDNAPEIRELYAGHTAIEYDLSYSAGRHYRGREIMFFGPGITPTEHESPVQVRRYA